MGYGAFLSDQNDTDGLTWLTADLAGKVLFTSGAAVRRLIRAGELPAARVGRRWLVEKADLKAFVAARKTRKNIL